MKNKIVLITGSSNGIGRETAFKFASEQAKVVITYCNDRRGGQNTEKRCRELGAAETLIIMLDLRENKRLEEDVDRVVKTFGKIDILINNAGVAVSKPLQEQSLADIENQIRTNLEGLIKMTRTCRPMNHITTWQLVEGFAELAYCATKGVRVYPGTWEISNRRFTPSILTR
jgi:3-oxoacyl-[acyl-carrier protein] reductase